MIYLSPTRLQRWFECGCPAKWNFERIYESKKKSEFAERGTLVHAMLAGEIDITTVEDTTAMMFFRKLEDARRMMGFVVEEKELRQEFPLMEDVMWVRVIDVVGRIDKTPTILDYKTTGAVWKMIADQTAPQAMASQSPGYLWRPSEVSWPTEMVYLVAGFRGAAGIYRYTKNDADDANFLEAVTMCRDALKAGYNPKIRGKGCLECEMKDVCYELPKWKSKYTKKKSGRSRK